MAVLRWPSAASLAAEAGSSAATVPPYLARLAGDGYQAKPKLAKAPRFESPLPGPEPWTPSQQTIRDG